MRPLPAAPALLLALSALLGCSRSVLLLDPGDDVGPADHRPPAFRCTNASWTRALAAAIGPQASAIAAGPGCEVYIAGSFSGTIDLGDGPLTSAGGSDAFVAKLSSDGEMLWSRQFGDEQDQQAVQIAAAPDGGVIIAGHVRGAIDLGGGPLEDEYTGAFLAKLDADGGHVFSRRFGPAKFPVSGDAVRITGLAVGPDGEAALKGYFEGTVDFGGGPLSSAGFDDIFVAKYGPEGDHVFSRRFGDAGYQSDAGGIAVDPEGGVVFTGGFEGVIDLGDGPVSSQGSHHALLAKLDRQGGTVWASTFGGSGFAQAGPIAVDSRGRVAIAGTFEGTLDLGGGPMTSTEGYHYNLFVAELDAAGHHRWSKRFGDIEAEEAVGLGYDASDRLILAGNFAGELVLGGQALYTAGGWDVFTVRFEDDGDPAESRQFGDEESQRCSGVATDPLGHVLMVGSFSGQVDFGGGEISSTPGDADAFVTRMGPLL